MRSEVISNCPRVLTSETRGRPTEILKKTCTRTITRKSLDEFHSGMFPETVRPTTMGHDVGCVETDLAPYKTRTVSSIFGKVSTFETFAKLNCKSFLLKTCGNDTEEFTWTIFMNYFGNFPICKDFAKRRFRLN